MSERQELRLVYVCGTMVGVLKAIPDSRRVRSIPQIYLRTFSPARPKCKPPNISISLELETVALQLSQDQYRQLPRDPKRKAHRNLAALIASPLFLVLLLPKTCPTRDDEVLMCALSIIIR